MLLFSVLIAVSAIFFSCNDRANSEKVKNESLQKEVKSQPKADLNHSYSTLKVAEGFDFPVGKPDGEGYYNAQYFGANFHLGEDWNGRGGGNTDLGDPVYSIANGYVREAYDAGPGWGNVVRVEHCYNEEGETKFIESLYAHLDTILVEADQRLVKGQQLGTIGNAEGAYLAHLHFEIRNHVGMKLGGGYSDNTFGFIHPTEFIKAHR